MSLGGQKPDWFHALLESAPDAIVISDEEGRIRIVNTQAETMFGYERRQLVGQQVDLLIPDRLRQIHAEHRDGYLEHPRTRQAGPGLDLVGRRKDGSEFPAEIGLSTFEAEGSVLVTAIVRDITERKNIEQTLQESERRLALIYDSVADPIFLLAVGPDDCFRFLSVNHAFLAATGLSADEVIGRRIEEVLPESSHALVIGNYKTAIGERRRVDWEEEAHFPAGKRVGLVTVAPTFDASGECTNLIGAVHDVTELRRNEEILRESEAKLRETLDALRRTDSHRRQLLWGVVAAQETERKRIAMDIHDDSIQIMTAAGLRLQTLRRQVSDPEQGRQIELIAATVSDAITRLRHLLLELRPAALDAEGLAQALRELLDQASAAAGFTFRIDNRLTRELDVDERVTLYRLIQEAIANARKHSRAKSVEVVLDERDDGWLATVRDDGIGFRTDETRQAPGHLGLTSMRERAELAGGTCQIESVPGRGTSVKIWLPRVVPPPSP